jgi:excinuclease ABC subunit A
MQASPATHIIVKGARQHNLKNIDCVIPKGKLVVFTGLSGSGKSSLAFDTIYAEGQRKYVESLSAYARQFLGVMQKPDVDQIDGLSPAISIDQKTTSHNPRSTVGTITEIYDYLRLLFARMGHPHCPQCGREIAPQTTDQIVNQVIDAMRAHTNSVPSRWYIQSPIVRDKKGEFSHLFTNLKKQGFKRVRVDNTTYNVDDDIFLLKTNRHSISVIMDRFSIDKATLKDDTKVEELKSRLRQTVDQSLELADGHVIVSQINDASLDFPENPKLLETHLYSQHLACPVCNISLPEIEPRIFSFNTPHGACPTCSGLGALLKIDPEKIVAPDLTISEGAIIPLANALSTNSWYAGQIKAVLKAHDADVTTQYKFLSEDIKRILLFGDHKSTYETQGINQQGLMRHYTFKFEGVIPNLERRFTETESDFMRGEIERYMRKEICPKCHGGRLKIESLSITVTGKNIVDVVNFPITEALAWINRLHQAINDEDDHLLTLSEKTIGRHIVKEIRERLNFLISVGLNYLTLHREAGSLAGGEAQRIRLASQIGTGLTGVLYVLDEPTIGLHPRDNDRLISTMKSLRDLGNTLIVVEHDKNVMWSSDYVFDFGPKAGRDGGYIVANGTPKEIAAHPDSLTGKYLSNQKVIDAATLKRQQKIVGLDSIIQPTAPVSGSLVLTGCDQHNLKNITAKFPLAKLTVITGVSGSGKSTLMHDTLYPALKFSLGQGDQKVSGYKSLTGTTPVTHIKLIDQSPIGRTPRSNAATYTKVFDLIRTLMASTKEAKLKGFSPGRFSFNVRGGRCEACRGDGQVKISMQFLPDVYVNCDVCKGLRYNAETLGIHYKDHTIADILNLTIDQALDLFKNSPQIVKKIKTLQAVGLGYIKLGQSAPTLSGGEAQRVKLAKELSTATSGHTVYLLDEPTTGLHFEDVKHLMVVLKQLVTANNTVIVIEHNLDVIANADYVIDLGPEGGDAGGQIIASGTPEEIKNNPNSFTGKYLKSDTLDR